MVQIDKKQCQKEIIFIFRITISNIRYKNKNSIKIIALYVIKK